MYRIMEKENKKARDDARKEYNETVRVCAGPSHYMRRLILILDLAVASGVRPKT